ncbi:unnamed protein product, partial [Prorocentrum cordatum]
LGGSSQTPWFFFCSITAARAGTRLSDLAMSASMMQQMPVYYSAADPSAPMPMVTAADVASAQPMAAEQIAQFLPMGVPQGFMPMIVYGGAAPPQAPPQAPPHYRSSYRKSGARTARAPGVLAAAALAHLVWLGGL